MQKVALTLSSSPNDTPPLDTVVSSLSRAREILYEMISSQDGMRNADLLWEAYSSVELSIGIGKLLFPPPAKMQGGVFAEISVSKNYDPQSMPAERMMSLLNAIRSDLEYAQYQVESGNGRAGIESARKARDSLKMLLLARRKVERGVKSSGKSTRNKQAGATGSSRKVRSGEATG